MHNQVDGRFAKWLLVSILLLSSLLLIHTGGAMAKQGEVVFGVLESVNVETGTVQIRNSLGQPIFLKIRKSHLLEGVTPGERVTVVVNEDHEIVKLIETPLPELPPQTSQ
jgi:hypothetical protein